MRKFDMLVEQYQWRHQFETLIREAKGLEISAFFQKYDEIVLLGKQIHARNQALGRACCDARLPDENWRTLMSSIYEREVL